MSVGRPGSILWFERIAYLSLALSTVNSLIVYSELRAAPPDTSHAGPGRILVFLIILLAIYIPLVRYAAHRASNLARWLLVGLLCIHLFGLMSIRAILDYGGLSAAIAVAQFPLSAILIWLLFRVDARLWFAGHRPVDPDTFR